MKQTAESTIQTIYVGLDVHKSSISVAYALEGGADPVFHGKLGGSNLALERGLVKLRKKLGVSKERLRIAYEAGPAGFVAARPLLQLGCHACVVAPSKIERAPGDRVKTDRRDALKLARLHRSGSLRPVHIPDAVDEAVRDVCRARTDAASDLRKARQRLGAFLLRSGIHYSGKTNWTSAHMRYLRELTLPDPAQNIVLEEYLQAVDGAAERTARLEAHLENLLPDWHRAPFVRHLMAMRGFRTVAAMTVIAELGDLSRFKHPSQLMAYLGLVPGEHSSGARRRQGSITKCGNTHVRWMLVECAQHYRLPPKVSRQLALRQEGVPRPVRELSWRAQNRLHRRTTTLSLRRLHHNKVTVAVARELCAFIWELANLTQSTRQSSPN